MRAGAQRGMRYCQAILAPYHSKMRSSARLLLRLTRDIFRLYRWIIFTVRCGNGPPSINLRLRENSFSVPHRPAWYRRAYAMAWIFPFPGLRPTSRLALAS